MIPGVLHGEYRIAQAIDMFDFYMPVSREDVYVPTYLPIVTQYRSLPKYCRYPSIADINFNRAELIV
jgi:hypothetical protein